MDIPTAIVTRKPPAVVDFRADDFRDLLPCDPPFLNGRLNVDFTGVLGMEKRSKSETLKYSLIVVILTLRNGTCMAVLQMGNSAPLVTKP